MTHREIAEAYENQLDQLNRLLQDARADVSAAYKLGRKDQANAAIDLLMSMAEERDAMADRLRYEGIPPHEDRQVARWLRRAAKHIRAGRDSL